VIENRVRETTFYWLMHGHPGHTISVPKGSGWTFNGDLVQPTFSPSVNEGGGHHYFINNGVVQYLSDKKCGCCEGQAEFYPMPPWDEFYTVPPRNE
jgi:hypothetical protein